MGTLGIGVNIWLYYDDIKNRGGQLDKVDAKRKKIEEDLAAEPEFLEID